MIPPMAIAYTPEDREILIKTVWGEARGESGLGKVAVAWVIINRAIKPQWPNTIGDVCLQPWQFSCWNDNDPNRDKLHSLDVESSDPIISACRRCVDDVLQGKVVDPTYGADHYYATWIPAPNWAKGEPTTAIGQHKFFNLRPIPTPKPPPPKEDTPVGLNYFLDFTMGLDLDGRLEDGRLVLRSLSDKGGRTHQIWVATTSIASRQKPEDFHQRGGPIPPEYRVPNLRAWEVETTPINLSHVKGIEGNFYKILPFAVTTDKGGQRSDLGIHYDGNVPGSLGCIVMSGDRFKSFEGEMRRLKDQAIAKIPLFVTYPTN
jgi:hypothetical protein